MATPFDPADYVRAPVITAATGVTLALALVDACPKSPPASVKKAKTYLQKTAEGAKEQLAERNKAMGAFPDEDSRALDNEADRGWGGLKLRLQGASMLPADKFPQAGRAGELVNLLFPEGMEFLKAPYETQSTAMGAILARIDKGKLAKEIDDLAGPEFLQAIKGVQPRYEAMVSERLRRDKATGQDLLETTRQLQAAIVNYAGKIVGMIEHDEPATVEAARVALLPIANFRATTAARASKGGAEEAGGGEGDKPQGG